ncbi:MAG: PPOX class F420-dependent oxidoreductase [Pseudonocardiaceae bacterium]
MSVFSQAELAYFDDGAKLGRLATVDATGAPHVVPVGWNYNPEHDTIDIGGRDFTATRKYRNVLANPKVCFVVDDVLPPFRPRCVQVRGEADALPSATWPDGRLREAIIRIRPTRVVSWGLDVS